MVPKREIGSNAPSGKEQRGVRWDKRLADLSDLQNTAFADIGRVCRCLRLRPIGRDDRRDAGGDDDAGHDDEPRPALIKELERNAAILRRPAESPNLAERGPGSVDGEAALQSTIGGADLIPEIEELRNIFLVRVNGERQIWIYRKIGIEQSLVERCRDEGHCNQPSPVANS